MARRKQKAEVTRVEMRSSGSTRSAMVPEGQVDRYRALGWSVVPTKRTSTRKKADDTATDDDE